MTDPNTPERISLTIHAGAASDGAVLTEWWHPLDGDIESRSLRFYGDSQNWLDEDALPARLSGAGCRITEVVGASDHPAFADPAVEAGQRLHLQPEPRNPYDPNAIAVFLQDKVSRVGYLPPDVAAETMAASRRLRSAFGALIVSESRRVGSGERVGIKVLIGPGSIRATMA